MAILNLFLCLVLSSCAYPKHRHVLQIKGFEAQVYGFELASRQAHRPIEIDDLIVTFNPDIIDSNEAGVCYRGSETTTPIIAISTQVWSYSTDQLKEQLMFHELGHCILWRAHRNVLYTDGPPVSIMYYSLAGFQTEEAIIFYQNYRDGYINELFNN